MQVLVCISHNNHQTF